MSDLENTIATRAELIRSANAKFGKQFTQWVTAVGGELRAAQQELARHKSGFDKWCKAEFGWSKQHVHRIMDANITIESITSPIGDVSKLPAPTNEAQCRELAAVPKDKVAEVWQQVVEHAEEKSQSQRS